MRFPMLIEFELRSQISHVTNYICNIYKILLISFIHIKIYIYIYIIDRIHVTIMYMILLTNCFISSGIIVLIIIFLFFCASVLLFLLVLIALFIMFNFVQFYFSCTYDSRSHYWLFPLCSLLWRNKILQ